MKTVVEIHVLQNFAPSNLNRDDTGAPKDAMFGGFRRARVSSQCQKRAVRSYFNEAVHSGNLTAEDFGTRTKRVLDALVQALVKEGKSEEEAVEKSRLALGAIELSIKEDGKSEYLLFLGQREIAGIAGVVLEQWETIVKPAVIATKDEKPTKKKKQASQGASPELKEALDKVFNGGKAVDVALFGRMLADMPGRNQNAACQVSHAISTHTVDREFDFYTAVDDLKPEDTSGADMMGTVEFNSACFYRYAVVDWEKLVGNLQSDAELAKKGVRAFLDGFVVAEPTGKQNTFAAHNRPKFVAVSVRRNTGPQSLTNAFEVPVRAGRSEAITKASAEALVSEAKTLNTAYGIHGQTRVLNPIAAEIDGFGEAVTTLEALLDWVIEELSEE